MRREQKHHDAALLMFSNVYCQLLSVVKTSQTQPALCCEGFGLGQLDNVSESIMDRETEKEGGWQIKWQEEWCIRSDSAFLPYYSQSWQTLTAEVGVRQSLTHNTQHNLVI